MSSVTSVEGSTRHVSVWEEYRGEFDQTELETIEIKEMLEVIETLGYLEIGYEFQIHLIHLPTRICRTHSYIKDIKSEKNSTYLSKI